jgi:hypothetical protein
MSDAESIVKRADWEGVCMRQGGKEDRGGFSEDSASKACPYIRCAGTQREKQGRQLVVDLRLASRMNWWQGRQHIVGLASAAVAGTSEVSDQFLSQDAVPSLSAEPATCPPKLCICHRHRRPT